MLTEIQARSLLATAATTVDVGPPRPIPEQRRRRTVLPLMVGAVAVLVVVGGGIAISRHDNATPPAGPAYDLYPGDATFHLGPDQVPPVEGYPAAQAKQLLGQQGYAVTETAAPRCPSDETVTAVSPQPGTIASAGQSIDLTVATFAGHPCPSGPPDTDPFLTWAQGAGPAPRFAASVWIENDDTRVATLTGASRTNPAAWPGLKGLVDAASGVSAAAPDRRTRSYRIVRNAVVVADAVCHGPRGDCGRYRNRAIEVHGEHTLLVQAVLAVGPRGAIRGVDVIDDRSTAGPFPDVLGDSAAYATARLGAFGYAVTEVPRVDCAPVGMVTKVAFDGRGVLVGVTDRTGACNPATP